MCGARCSRWTGASSTWEEGGGDVPTLHVWGYAPVICMMVKCIRYLGGGRPRRRHIRRRLLQVAHRPLGPWAPGPLLKFVRWQRRLVLLLGGTYGPWTFYPALWWRRRCILFGDAYSGIVSPVAPVAETQQLYVPSIHTISLIAQVRAPSVRSRVRSTLVLLTYELHLYLR